ncbi:SAC3/GANP family protein [Babesia bovis T2Bo]|uniref:SAC3/GANP family protein n=1 Tax=Babesia bovis TaxID=5865 RepID=A7APC9_BABBO|nr:SAC3/GANP family protein [Babesia bovis T2Bo]EDO08413.1 SAC3/GANP family protein [Babesia bovis T2Bo]|eukprot:XP_001611981.1 SAC3/GANP family protein [Babesia bovis T2Bo]
MATNPPDYLGIPSGDGTGPASKSLKNVLLRPLDNAEIGSILIKHQEIASLTKGSTPGRMVGEVLGMCPLKEIRQKVEMNTASDLERVNASTVNPKLALKSFQRSDASRVFKPEETRPAVWCRRTIYNILCYFVDADIVTKPYLMDKKFSYLDVYNFLRDRLRSIWQDLTVQHCTKHRAYIECFEISIRFLIYSNEILCENEEYDIAQNRGLLNTCLDKLMEGYESVHKYLQHKSNNKRIQQPDLILNNPEIVDTLVYRSPHEAEFWGYRLLMHIPQLLLPGGSATFCDIVQRMPNDLRGNASVKFAIEVCHTAASGNVYRYFTLMRDADCTALFASVMNRASICLRVQFMEVLVNRSICKKEVNPLDMATFNSLFGFVDESLESAEKMLSRYGITTYEHEGKAYLDFANADATLLETERNMPQKLCIKFQTSSSVAKGKFESIPSRQLIFDPDFEYPAGTGPDTVGTPFVHEAIPKESEPVNTKSIFGIPTATSIFGASSTTGPIFNFGTTSDTKPVFQFGVTDTNSKAPSSTPSLFGSSNQSMFGSNSNPFGSSNSTIFGTNNQSTFGSNSNPFGSSNSTIFGTNSQSTFGSSGNSMFGSGKTGAFGTSSQPGFGTSNANVFGTTSQTMFATNNRPTESSNSNSVFGSTNSNLFGTNTQPTDPTSTNSVFGTTSQTMFATNTQQSESSSSNFIFGSVNTNVFGTSNQSIFGTNSISPFGTSTKPFGTTESTVFGSGKSNIFAPESKSALGSSDQSIFVNGNVNTPTSKDQSTPDNVQTTVDSSKTIFGTTSQSIFGSTSSVNIFGAAKSEATKDFTFGTPKNDIKPFIFGDTKSTFATDKQDATPNDVSVGDPLSSSKSTFTFGAPKSTEDNSLFKFSVPTIQPSSEKTDTAEVGVSTTNKCNAPSNEDTKGFPKLFELPTSNKDHESVIFGSESSKTDQPVTTTTLIPNEDTYAPEKQTDTPPTLTDSIISQYERRASLKKIKVIKPKLFKHGDGQRSENKNATRWTSIMARLQAAVCAIRDSRLYEIPKEVLQRSTVIINGNLVSQANRPYVRNTEVYTSDPSPASILESEFNGFMHPVFQYHTDSIISKEYDIASIGSSLSGVHYLNPRGSKRYLQKLYLQQLLQYNTLRIIKPCYSCSSCAGVNGIDSYAVLAAVAKCCLGVSQKLSSAIGTLVHKTTTAAIDLCSKLTKRLRHEKVLPPRKRVARRRNAVINTKPTDLPPISAEAFNTFVTSTKEHLLSTSRYIANVYTGSARMLTRIVEHINEANSTGTYPLELLLTIAKDNVDAIYSNTISQCSNMITKHDVAVWGAGIMWHVSFFNPICLRTTSTGSDLLPTEGDIEQYQLSDYVIRLKEDILSIACFNIGVHRLMPSTKGYEKSMTKCCSVEDKEMPIGVMASVSTSNDDYGMDFSYRASDMPDVIAPADQRYNNRATIQIVAKSSAVYIGKQGYFHELFSSERFPDLCSIDTNSSNLDYYGVLQAFVGVNIAQNVYQHYTVVVCYRLAVSMIDILCLYELFNISVATTVSMCGCAGKNHDMCHSRLKQTLATVSEKLLSEFIEYSTKLGVRLDPSELRSRIIFSCVGFEMYTEDLGRQSKTAKGSNTIARILYPQGFSEAIRDAANATICPSGIHILEKEFYIPDLYDFLSAISRMNKTAESSDKVSLIQGLDEFITRIDNSFSSTHWDLYSEATFTHDVDVSDEIAIDISQLSRYSKESFMALMKAFRLAAEIAAQDYPGSSQHELISRVLSLVRVRNYHVPYYIGLYMSNVIDGSEI